MVTEKKMSVMKLVERIKKGTVVINISYYNPLYIDMAIAQIPLPKVYAKEDSNANIIVLSDFDVVSTLCHFYESDECNGLEQKDINRIAEAEITFVVFPPDVHKNKFESVILQKLEGNM